MYVRLCLLVLLVVAVATSAASAAEPSFSCAAARNWDERAICADAELAALDVDLDRAFKAARAALPDQAEAILRDQRAWLGIRGRVCRERGGTVGAAAIACLAERTNARLAELVRLREPASAAASLQHRLSRGANGGAVGEASLAAGESGPEIAVAAILAFARGDRVEATRRIEEAESKVPDGPGFDNYVSGLMGFHTDIRLLDEWANDPSLAEGPNCYDVQSTFCVGTMQNARSGRRDSTALSEPATFMDVSRGGMYRAPTSPMKRTSTLMR